MKVRHIVFVLALALFPAAAQAAVFNCYSDGTGCNPSEPLPEGWYNVRDFSNGYHPVCDGSSEASAVTNDTQAIQAAIAAATGGTEGTDGNGVVYFPPGHCLINDTLVIPNGVELRGAYGKEGSGSTGPSMIEWCGSVGDTIIEIGTAGTSTHNTPIRHLSLSGGESAGYCPAAQVRSADTLIHYKGRLDFGTALDDVRFRNAGVDAILMDEGATNFHITRSRFDKIEGWGVNVDASNSGKGLATFSMREITYDHTFTSAGQAKGFLHVLNGSDASIVNMIDLEDLNVEAPESFDATANPDNAFIVIEVDNDLVDAPPQAFITFRNVFMNPQPNTGGPFAFIAQKNLNASGLDTDQIVVSGTNYHPPQDDLANLLIDGTLTPDTMSGTGRRMISTVSFTPSIEIDTKRPAASFQGDVYFDGQEPCLADGSNCSFAQAPDWTPYFLSVWRMDEASGNRLNDTATTCGASCDLTDNNTVPSNNAHREGAKSALLNWSTTTNEYFSCTDATCGGTTNLDGGTRDWSVGCWARNIDVGGTNTVQQIMRKRGAADTQGYWLRTDETNSRLDFMIRDQQWFSANSSWPIDGTWRHAVMTYSTGGNGGKGYINATVNGTKATTVDVGDNTAAFEISWDTGPEVFDGNLDECFVIALELSATDVCRICSCGIDGSQCHGYDDTYTDTGYNAQCGSCTLPAFSTQGPGQSSNFFPPGVYIANGVTDVGQYTKLNYPEFTSTNGDAGEVVLTLAPTVYKQGNDILASDIPDRWAGSNVLHTWGDTDQVGVKYNSTDSSLDWTSSSATPLHMYYANGTKSFSVSPTLVAGVLAQVFLKMRGASGNQFYIQENGGENLMLLQESGAFALADLGQSGRGGDLRLWKAPSAEPSCSASNNFGQIIVDQSGDICACPAGESTWTKLAGANSCP